MIGIKNYDMPYNCYDCELHNYHECNLTSESIEDDYCWNGDSREKHCPLVEAIPKDQYESRLKADMVAMLTEIQLEIEELPTNRMAVTDSSGLICYGYSEYEPTVKDASKIIQQKINELKGEQEGEE